MSESDPQDTEHVLCSLDDIPIGRSKGFAADPEAYCADILVVRTEQDVYAYRNRCPHTGVPMEWQPDQFLDHTGTLIQCGLHAAQFRIHDGYCVAGPCESRSLESVPVAVRDGVLIALQDPELWCDD